MNVNKSKYRFIKEKLNAFGTRFKKVKSDIKRTKEFWEDKLYELVNGTWDYLIAEYLILECTEEERIFLDLIFFRKAKITQVCLSMHLSENACRNRITVIYNDFISLAAQRGLLSVCMGEEKLDVACCISDLEDYKFEQIYKLISENGSCKIVNLRNVLEAIILVETTKIAWRDIPNQYGLWKTIYNIYNKWKRSGIWDKIKDILI